MTDNTYNWIGKIQTISGRHVDVMNPDPDTIILDDIVHAISNLCRYGGHIPHFYSVAEHSTYVAKWLHAQDATPDEIITGLLHDAAEAYIGDIVRPLKEHPDFGNTAKNAEERILTIVHAKYGGTYPHADIIHQADQAIYHWEVANIRNGYITGWQPGQAREQFIAAYNEYRQRPHR